MSEKNSFFYFAAACGSTFFVVKRTPKSTDKNQFFYINRLQTRVEICRKPASDDFFL